MHYSINLRPTPYALRPYATNGFTLIETLVGSLVVVILTLAVYQAYTVLAHATQASQATLDAITLAEQQLEDVRAMNYSDIGTVAGAPNGLIPSSQTVVRDAFAFQITTTVQGVHADFDTGNPSATDYKLVEVAVGCSVCKNFAPVAMTTYVAQK